jgi:hypothetical protein
MYVSSVGIRPDVRKWTAASSAAAAATLSAAAVRKYWPIIVSAEQLCPLGKHYNKEDSSVKRSLQLACL